MLRKARLGLEGQHSILEQSIRETQRVYDQASSFRSQSSYSSRTSYSSSSSSSNRIMPVRNFNLFLKAIIKKDTSRVLHIFQPSTPTFKYEVYFHILRLSKEVIHHFPDQLAQMVGCQCFK